MRAQTKRAEKAEALGAELLEALRAIVASREAKHSATYAVDLTDSIDRARRLIAKATGSDKP
jgi:hypothetical protein